MSYRAASGPQFLSKMTGDYVSIQILGARVSRQPSYFVDEENDIQEHCIVHGQMHRETFDRSTNY